MSIVPDLSVLLPYVAAVIVLTLTPGPDMTLFLGKTVSQSRAAGMAAFAGAATGLFVHSAMVAVGLSALLVASATAFTVLKVLGAGYLMWLAVDALRSGSSFTLEERPPESLSRLYATGLLVNLLNPKIIVFFLTFLPQFVSPSDPAAPGKLFVLGAIFVVVATPIVIFMIAAAGSLARLLAGSRLARRTVDYLFATVLGAFAVKLLVARAE